MSSENGLKYITWMAYNWYWRRLIRCPFGSRFGVIGKSHVSFWICVGAAASSISSFEQKYNVSAANIRTSFALAEKVWKVSQSTMIARDRNLIFCYFPNLHFSALLNGGWSHNSGTIIFCIAELNSEIGVKVIRQIHLV